MCSIEVRYHPQRKQTLNDQDGVRSWKLVEQCLDVGGVLGIRLRQRRRDLGELFKNPLISLLFNKYSLNFHLCQPCPMKFTLWYGRQIQNYLYIIILLTILFLGGYSSIGGPRGDWNQMLLVEILTQSSCVAMSMLFNLSESTHRIESSQQPTSHYCSKKSMK